MVRIQEEGVILLGTPLGSEEFVGREVEKKVEKVKNITELLPQLKDPHTEFVLLRSCLALPKLSFLLRTTNTSSHTNHLQEFDRVTREGLIRILGTPLGDRAWQQAKLPVAMGGMGLRGAEDHSSAAYAASVVASRPLTRLLLHAGRYTDQEPRLTLPVQLVESLAATLGEEVREEELVGVTQKQLAVKVDLRQQRLLQEQIGEDEVRERARMASLSLPHAGDWLNTAPLTALGLHLRPAEFVLVAKYRLGMELYSRSGPCPACLRPSDNLGDHALCCGTGGERISRHNHLRDALYETAVAAGLGPTKEGRFLLPGADRRPADVLIPHWAGGRDAALDVTVVNPLQVATLAGAATTPGHGLSFAYNRKVRGAQEDCRRQGIAFLPMAAESFGGWHSVAEQEVRKLGTALARHTRQEEEEAVRHLWGRLGILLQRGNAAILGNRVPTYPDTHIDGTL